MHTLALLALTYVFIPSGSNLVTSSNVDIHRLLAIRDRYGSHFLWVKRDGKEYVIRDRATLEAVDRLFDAAHADSPELERLRERMRPLEAREERLDKEADAISDDDHRSARDEDRLRELHRELRDVQAQLRDLERDEERLDRKQDRLEQEAEEKMVPIVDDAIRRGLGQRE